MSKEFIYTNSYTTKDCEIKVKDLPSTFEPSSTYRTLFLKLEDHDNFRKEFVECLANGFKDLVIGLSNDKPTRDSKVTNDGIGIQIKDALKQLGNFMGYFVNSSSWHEQELKNYDKYELINRLQKVIVALKQNHEN